MPPLSAPPSGGAGSPSANSSSANSERSATSSGALTLSAWRRPSLLDTRRRSENFALTDERHGTRRRIWLQIDDLGVGRYLTIPEIFPVRVHRRLDYPASLGLDRHCYPA